MENNYDIISLGLYERGWDEVKAVLKDLGITTVIDARSQRSGRYDPVFAGSKMEGAVEKEGFSYMSLPSLDGKSRDPRVHLMENLDAPVNYQAVMADTKFREQMDTLIRESERGKVALLTNNASAYSGPAAKLVGQYLESTTDKKIGHVTGVANGQAVISSQERVIDNSLGRGLAVLSGDYRNIAFTSDGKWTAAGDVKVGRVKREERTADRRTIVGEWNFGSEGTIKASKGDKTTTALENAAWADYTVAISNSFVQQDARVNRLAAGDNYIQVRIPSEREAFFDEEGNISEALVKRVSTSISTQIAAHVARDMFDDGRQINPDALKVNIVGAHIARLSNEYKEKAVMPEDLDKTSASLMRDADSHLVEMTGPDQEVINDFMSRVISEIRQGYWGETGSGMDNGEQPSFRIGEVRTNGESGIAEAAVVACQEHGISWNINAPKNYPWTKDNETLQGELVYDRPSFENRFKQGYTKELTEEQMRDQAHQQTYLRSMDEISLEPGLKDNQVALLQILGFSNNDINQMIEIARVNKEVIMDNAQMQQFIENCGGYGIASSEFINEAAVTNAQEELSDLLAKCEERGISFITPANPAYPKALSRMSSYTETVQEPEVVMENGVASISMVEKEVESTAPAILWYKGDLDLLQTNSVAIFGNEANSNPYDLMFGEHTVPEEKEVLARELGREAAMAGVTTVATLQDGTEMTAVNESMRHGGKSVLVSSQPLTSAKLADYSDNVVKNGGLVLSEQPPVGKVDAVSANDEHIWENRAKRLTSGLSGTAAFIEGMASKREMNIVEGAAYLGLGVIVFMTRRAGRNLDRLGQKFAKDDNVHTVEPTTENVKEAIRQIAGKTEGVAESQSVNAGVRNAQQMPVEVLRMEGRQPVFLVSSNRPDVRQAIIKECGNNVQFASPSSKAEVMASLYGYPEGYEWKRGMGPYYGGASAAAQKPMVHEDVVFFDKGKVHTLATAPDQYPGLKPMKTRRQNIAAFESFRSRAEELQDRFQTALDMPDSAPLYLGGSRYLAIKPNSVEILEGTELKARVYLSSTGMLRFENIESLSTSMGEYFQSERPLLTGRMNDMPNTLDSLLGQMEEALYGRGQGESDSIALATREEQEALAQELTTGFRSPGSDNVDLAGVDVARGLSEGTLTDSKAFRIPDADLLYYDAQLCINEKKTLKEGFEHHRAELYGIYESQQQSVAGSVESLSSLAASEDMSFEANEKVNTFIQMVQEDTSYETLRTHLDEMTRSEGDLSVPEDVLVRCEALLAEHEACRSTMDSLQADMRGIREADKDIEALEAAKFSLAKGEKVRLALSPTDNDRYVIGGVGISLPQHDYADVDRTAVLKDMAEQKTKSHGRAVITERTEFQTLGKGKAFSEEVVPDSLSNGVLIVQRDGKMAYADKDLNIISDFYDKCRPFSGKYGRVENEGKVNLVTRNGQEILGTWALGIGGVHEGFAQVKREDGKMNLINMDSFQFVGDRWFSRLDIVSNGLAMVGNERGQYNYIDTEGALFSRDEWFGSAERFSHGVARITCLDGTEYTVNTSGETQSAQVIDKAQEQGYAQTTNSIENTEEITPAPSAGQKLSRR